MTCISSVEASRNVAKPLAAASTSSPRPQLRLLRGDARGAVVGVADPRRHAPDGLHGRCSTVPTPSAPRARALTKSTGTRRPPVMMRVTRPLAPLLVEEPAGAGQGRNGRHADVVAEHQPAPRRCRRPGRPG